MTTVREAMEELDHFCCPECGMCMSLDRKYDPSMVDTITIECQCGADMTFGDLDTSLTSGIQWRDHEVGKDENGLPICANCGKTIDLAPGVASKIPDPYLMLWGLCIFEWGSDAAASRSALETIERFK
jgi:hypothetical protein